MDRRIVMYDGLHTLIGKVLLQFVPTVALGHQIYEGVELVRPLFRQLDWGSFQQLAIKGHIRPTTFDHFIEPAEPETQDRGLQGVEPGDVAELGDAIAVDEAMVTQQPSASGDCVGIGGDEAGITDRVKNLEWMSRETPNRAQRACATIAIARSHRLRGILD